MNRHASWSVALIGVAMLLGLATAVRAGSPLGCFPYQIGDNKSLPWGTGAFDRATDYDPANVVTDTLALLKTEKDTLTRMETLRRAAIYVSKDRARATELLAKLSWMALDAEATENKAWAAGALFDAGLLAATYAQMGIDVGFKMGVADGLQGWAWVEKSLKYAPDDPAKQFAAALIRYDRKGSSEPYLARAVADAEPGSRLARSIESIHVVGGRTLEELRATLKVTEGSSVGKKD